MSGLALAARLVLAAVFAVAGAAKLRDRPGTVLMLEDFGAPARLASPGALLLPVAELAVAVLLLPDATAAAAAAGALALLAVFIVAIAVNLARGHQPDCNCFGQLHSEPVGPATLVRNDVLALLAGFVLMAGQDSTGARALHGLAGLDTATALAAAALAVSLLGLAALGWVALHLLRQQGRVLLRLDALDGASGHPAPRPPEPGLPVGAPAPGFELATTSGDRVGLPALIGAEHPLALVFAEPGCGPCGELMPQLAARGRDEAAATIAVIVSGGDAEAATAMAAVPGLPLALLDRDSAVAARYGVPGTPVAVAIGPDGLIRSDLAAGPEAVHALLDRLDAGAGNGAGLPIIQVGGRDEAPDDIRPALGERVPDADLEDLDGDPVSLRRAAGGAAHLLLFWSPTCGFCDAMLEDLRRLEARDDLPPLLVVATGDAAANREQGLRSRTLLDPAFAATGEAFGVAGTPSALRLDAEGRIASRLAVGAGPVLALAGAAPAP